LDTPTSGCWRQLGLTAQALERHHAVHRKLNPDEMSYRLKLEVTQAAGSACLLARFWHASHSPANSSVCVSTRNFSLSARRNISASMPVASTGTTELQPLHSRW